jgi:peptidoglycan/LPS O-acetylase OafA/YrhL
MDKSRIDAITGLRGFAALLVFYAHLAEKSWLKPDPHFPGEVGVMIFFSLSGFLIAYLYLGKEFSVAGVADYVTARIARIAPAYLFIMLASFLIYTQIDPQFVYAIYPGNLLRHVFFSGNVSVFWSIAPEVQFYGLFLLIWAAVGRFRDRSDVIGLILLAIFCVLLLSYRDGFPGTFVGAKLHYFLFGVIAGVLRTRIDADRQDSISLGILHALLIGLAIAVELDFVAFPFLFKLDFYQSLPTAFLSALFVLSFSLPSAIGKLLFENKAMLACGECSFSLYLLNMPVIYFFKKLAPDQAHVLMSCLIIAVVLALSLINYRCIERPGARLIRLLGKRLMARLALTGRAPAPVPEPASDLPPELSPTLQPNLRPDLSSAKGVS